MDSFLKRIRDFRDSIKFGSLTSFKITMDSFLKRIRDFRDSIKVGVLNTFFNNIKSLNVLVRKLKGNLGTSPIEKATSSPSSIIDVRLVDISDSVKKFLLNLKGKGTTVVQRKDKDDKESGSLIGKIIKGIIGTIALVAGVGFISQFLDTPIGRILKPTMGKMMDRFIEFLKPFAKKLIDYSIEGLKVLFFELPKYFLKQTFNFFGLKEILGKENEGLAVLLTKGIYYGVKSFFVKTLNNFSFGGFSKLLKFIKPLIDFVPTTLGKLFSKIGGELMGTLAKPFSTLKNSFNIVKGSATTIVGKISGFFSVFKMIPTTIMKFFSNMGFGAGGGISKVIGSVAKLGGGSIFKLLGTMFKNVAKRIPFIGGLISFKDAYDRFKKGDYTGGLISIGSGIASFFPFIGTAISIGLDVLNAILDNKSTSSGQSKGNIIMDFAGSILTKITDGIGGFLKSIWDIITEVFEAAIEFVKNKAKDVYNHVYGKIDTAVDSVGFNPNIKKSSQEDQKEIEALRENARKRREGRLQIQQPINDGRVSGNKVIVPSTSDDVIAAKTGGPFDMAFRQMNEKLNTLTSIFAEGVQMISNASIQGSSSIVQAVAATGGKSVPATSGGYDQIAEYRKRADKYVD